MQGLCEVLLKSFSKTFFETFHTIWKTDLIEFIYSTKITEILRILPLSTKFAIIAAANTGFGATATLLYKPQYTT